MKLDQLQYFLETARAEHVGKASRILAISPSAVSHSLAALEEELGCALFTKHGTGIRLTAAGALARDRVARILADLQGLKEELADAPAAFAGHHRLAGSHVLCARFLMPAWGGLQAEHPDLSAEVATLRSAQVVAGVLAGDHDFGLCFSPQGQPGLVIDPVHQGTLVLVVGPGHPLLRLPEERRIEGLSAYPAALPKAWRGIEVCEAHPVFAKFGIAPRPAFAFDSYEVAAAMLASSDAWSFFPDRLLAHFPLSVRLLAKPDAWQADYAVCAVRRRGQFEGRLAAEMLARLRATFTASDPV